MSEMSAIQASPVLPVDWEALRAAARNAMRHAYAPYSGYRVGAAALTDNGRVVTGCNVENASYGVGLCAECGLVSQLHASGGGRLVAFSCCDGEGRVIMPCGRCRQLLNEFKAGGMLIDTPQGVMPFEQILPQAFGPQDLER